MATLVGEAPLRERKWIGDGFAVSHLAHLCGIVWLASPDVGGFVRAQKPSIVVAAAMYLILFAMAITSVDRLRKAMPKRAWLGLHRTGMHLAWVVFATSYAPRVAAGPIWILPIAVLVGIAAVRGTAWLRARTAQRARVSVAA